MRLVGRFWYKHPLCQTLCAYVGPGIAEGDENCKKFMEKTMPDAFQKVRVLMLAV